MSSDPLSTPDEPEPPSGPAVCPLCDAHRLVGAERCASCGYFFEASSAHPLSRTALWMLAGVLAAVYVVSLVLVAAAR